MNINMFLNFLQRTKTSRHFPECYTCSTSFDFRYFVRKCESLFVYTSAKIHFWCYKSSSFLWKARWFLSRRKSHKGNLDKFLWIFNNKVKTSNKTPLLINYYEFQLSLSVLLLEQLLFDSFGGPFRLTGGSWNASRQSCYACSTSSSGAIPVPWSQLWRHSSNRPTQRSEAWGRMDSSAPTTSVWLGCSHDYPASLQYLFTIFSLLVRPMSIMIFLQPCLSFAIRPLNF